MASYLLTKEEQNFIRFVKARDDAMPHPLRDILAWQINPKDLHHKIQSCSTLMNGDKKLDPYQVGICLPRRTIRTDYSDFDVTLLYKLIRNLCPGLKPTQGWGSKPNVNNTKIGDDIERIRVLRNESGHLKSPLISDNEFQRCWTELKIVIERLQKMMLKNGYNTDYEKKLRDIENLDLGNEPREKYKTYLVLEYAYNRLQADDREKPEVVISGNDKVLCGDMAVFEANVVYVDPVCWSLTWQRARGHVTERIDKSKEKYKRSTDRKLVISPVSKDDEWKYQAVLSKNTNGNEQWTLSNEIFLQALGDLPCLAVWKVTTEIEDITIHYSVIDKPPKAYKIEWKKNSETLDCKQRRYDGGSLGEGYLRIKASTFEDRGKYSCTVTNAVGSISRFVQIDVPYAKIYTEPYAFYGSQTNIDCKLSSCPLPDEAEWQKSVDGIAFHCIDISEPKYYGSSKNIENPLIVIPKVTFDDTQFYRLVLRNKIGEYTSDKVHIIVKGSPPNITTSHETCIQSRSVRLIGKAFLYEKFPTIHTLFWTKNGKKLDTHLSKGKYSEVSIDNPSLTIFNVNQHDAGSYQLTAINEVGSTNSEDIILSVPDVLLAKHEDKNGGYCFPVTINAIPAPIFVQWSIKDKNSVIFKAIDVNDEKYSGTSNSLPNPVLVVKQTDELETCFFQIEVQNFIGSRESIIPANISYEDPKPDTKTFRSLSKLYNDQGASVLFAELFDELVERFPNNRFHRLLDLIKNSGKVEDMGSVKQANCVRDCFRILRDENLFLHEDVIFMQYLLKTTNCDELYRRCYEYAKLQKALCFYEMPSENGFKNVKFHVQGNLKDYNREQIDIIKSTVATLLRCTLQDIRVNGFEHSTSFFVILSINETYFTKLFAMDESDKGKIARLHIDYFIADFRTVYLKRPKETDFPSLQIQRNVIHERNYRYADISRRDVTNAITHFKDLRPDHDLFILNDGNRKELLHLDGTIPVTYKGIIYNIPICVWIMDTHPYNPPMVFVKPTSTMQIKTGRHVDSNGKVDLPYLHDWRFPQSDLLGLIQILAIVFGEEPPVYSKQSQMTQSSSPNSYPGTGKYPGVSRQCIDPETTFNPFAAHAPIHGQGYNLDIFFQTMERFELDDIMNALIEHGVDCVETFCSMTESDFKEIGLNIGQRRKCILAAEHIKNYGLNG